MTKVRFRSSRVWRRCAAVRACTSAPRTTRGLHHLVYEIVDNAVDEALAGFCTTTSWSRCTTTAPSPCEDNGRGFPVGIHPTMVGRPAVEVCLTVLHAGGKFGGERLQGLRRPARRGRVGGQRPVQPPARSNVLSGRQDLPAGIRARQDSLRPEGRGRHRPTPAPPSPSGPTSRPAKCPSRAFSKPAISASTRSSDPLPRDGLPEQGHPHHRDRRARGTARRAQPIHYEGGIISFVEYLNKNKEAAVQAAHLHRGREGRLDGGGGAAVERRLLTKTCFSFANNIYTPEGGTHLAGFRNRAHPRGQRLRPQDRRAQGHATQNLTGDDVREGLTAIVSVKLVEPQFEGQTKTKLGNSEMRTAGGRHGEPTRLADLLRRKSRRRPGGAGQVPVRPARAREAARKARDLTRRKTRAGIRRAAGQAGRLLRARPQSSARSSSSRATPQAARAKHGPRPRTSRPSCPCAARS